MVREMPESLQAPARRGEPADPARYGSSKEKKRKETGGKSSWDMGNREGRANVKAGRNHSGKCQEQSVILGTGLIRCTIHTEMWQISGSLQKNPTTPTQRCASVLGKQITATSPSLAVKWGIHGNTIRELAPA